MRYWVGGMAVAPFSQTNTPAVARYWVGGLPIGRLAGPTPVPPPPGNTSKPKAMQVVLQEEAEPEFVPHLREFASPIVVLIAPFRRFLMPPDLLEEIPEEFIRRRRVFTTITVADNINISIIW